MLIGKLRSNYPHVDSYPEYTKIFSWYLSPVTTSRILSFDKNPVIVFTNGVSAITISHSRTGVKEAVAKDFDSLSLAHISVPARVTYLVMRHVLESYERFAEQFEGLLEKFEGVVPPWPRHFYAEAFGIGKEASGLLRLLRHFRMLTESLSGGRVHIPLSDEEKRILDAIYERVMGTEDMAEITVETVKDLISMHLDTVSNDMNKTMRLLAAITVMVAIPSVIGSLFGMNLIDQPWPLRLWEVALVGVTITIMLAIYFYRKGWFSDL